MRISSQQKILIGFGVGLILILFITVATYQTVTAYQQAINSVTQSSAAEGSLRNLLVELVDAETGQRGYIITGNAIYSQAYLNAVASINSTQQVLLTSIAGDANLTSEYQKLQPVMAARLSDLQRGVEVRRTQGFAAAEAIVGTNVGEEYMNEIRAIITRMVSQVDLLQGQEVILATQVGAQRVGIAFVDSLFAIGVFAIAAYTVGQTLNRAERARSQAELLQDILTHDIRNYNQIALLNAELLNERLKGQGEMEALTAGLIRGIDGSTRFVERAQRLGKVISEGKPRLHPVDLIQSIDRAMILARRAYPNKEVNETREMSDHTRSTLPGINVLADDLLDEVFLNLFSNAIKFTEGTNVAIDIIVEEWPPKGVDRKDRSSSVESKIGKQIRAAIDRPSWRVSVADRGPGIPNDQKLAIFDRYTSFWKGTGLGMSIVHALVVGRYDGAIVVRDNDQDFPTERKMSGKGTVFVLSLLKA